MGVVVGGRGEGKMCKRSGVLNQSHRIDTHNAEAHICMGRQKCNFLKDYEHVIASNDVVW